MQNTLWSSPISEEDRLAFIAQVRQDMGPNADVEDVTMRWSFLIAATEHGSAANLGRYDVTSLAADPATAATATDAQTAGGTGRPSWLTSRTQDPVTGGDTKTTPRSQLIMLGGIGVVVQLPLVVAQAAQAPASGTNWAAVAAADDALAGIQAAFDASTIEILDGRVRRVEAIGHEVASYGASRVAVYGPPATTTLDSETGVTTTNTLVYAGQASSKDRGWKAIKPTIISADSQLSIILNVPRATDWPIRTDSRFRVDVMCPGLMGRMTNAASGGSGANCNPSPAVPPPPGYGVTIVDPRGGRW